MYSIYADDICIYDNVSPLDNMKVVNPKLILSDCAAGSLSITLPPNNVGYNTIERMITDITVKKDGEEIWAGRVLSEKQDFWKNRVLYCEGELSFFNDSIQPPKKYSGLTVRGYLEELVAVHNSKVGANRQFQLGVITVHDDDYPDRFTNYETTMDVINNLIETYGGHMRVRKENGVRYLDYLETPMNTCTQTIQLGINLVNFTKSWDMSEFATVIVPIGARLNNSNIKELDAYLTVESVNQDSIYVKSDEAVAAYGWIEKTVRWDNVDDASLLLEKAQEYLSDLQFDNMALELSALDLHYLDVNIEAVKLIDSIRVVSPPHGLDKVFPVTKLEIPLDSPEKTDFTLGDTVQTSLTSVNNQANQAILNRIEDIPKAHNVLEEAKENATAIMNMATTGFITITKDEYGSDTLYISNTRDYQAASKYWKWNANGLAYWNNEATTNPNDPYDLDGLKLALTMDGAIVADRITVGTMSADRVRTGVLESVASIDPKTNQSVANVSFDLTNGKLTMRKGSIYLGQYDSDSKHFKFEVDEDGNVYAGGGTFAGTVYATAGRFHGTIQATDFLDANGDSMLDTEKRLQGKHLSLSGIEIKNGTQTIMKFNENGVEMYGGAITWKSNISSSKISGLASVATSGSFNDLVNKPDYIKSTYIDFSQVNSPNIRGNDIGLYGGHFSIYDSAGTNKYGFIGHATGAATTDKGDAITTDGVALSASDTAENISYSTSGNYIIATTKGIRLHSGSNINLYLTPSGAYYDNGNGTVEIGGSVATFG